MRYHILVIFLSTVLTITVAGGGKPWAQAKGREHPGHLVKLRMIVLKNSEDAESALSALNSGTSFVRLAKEISAGPNADRGGHIGTVNINMLKPELRNALKGLKPGQHTGVVETAIGHAIFQVTTDAYYEKGLELFDKSRYRDAIQEFKRDLELNPDSAFSYFYLGLSQNNLNQNRQAAASLETAVRLEPDLAETYYNLGRVYSALERIPDSERMYRKAIKLAPDFHLAHNNLAWLYAKNRTNIEDGIQHAEKAVQLSPSTPAYYHTLAMLYMAAGRKDDALQSMKMAAKLAPDNAHYKKQLAALEASSPGGGTPSPRPSEKARAEYAKGTERPISSGRVASRPSQEMLKEKEASYFNLKIKVLNGNGAKGAASDFAQKLRAMNYHVEKVGNAESFDWARTTIFYRKEKVDEALSLAHKIPGEQDVFLLRDHQPFDLVIILGRE